VGHQEEEKGILNLRRLKYEGFVEQIKKWWSSYECSGLPSHILAFKLKALKTDLKKWNAEVFGDVRKKKKELLEGICELDSVDEGRGLEEEEKVRKIDMSREQEKTLLFEEIIWKQKSRAVVEGGGQEHKFFSQDGQLESQI